MRLPPIESAQDLQAKLVLGASPKTLALALGSAWLLAAAMWEGNPNPPYAVRAFGWATLMTLVLLRGIVIARKGCHGPGDAHRQSERLQRNGLGVAFLWGITSSVLLPVREPAHEILLIIAISLITMGGAIGRAVHIPSIQLFVMITGTVFALGLMVQPSRFHTFLGLGYLMFGPVIALFTRAQENTLRRERELNIEIEQLLQQTEHARREAERARTEAEAARQQAERASAAKTRFLATASHDLRQPMHSIGLIVGLLHDRVDDPELARLTTRVQASIASMEALFGSLLDISKLDAGAVQPHIEIVNLGALLRRLELIWAPQAAERGLRLRVRPTTLRVRSDAELLGRIASNLIANAIRYTDRGGVLVAVRGRGPNCLLQVRDSGRGIAQEHQAAIFEEFYRLSSPGDAQDKGLGLGLSIVQRSAQLLAHPLRVVSRLGAGSLFELAMPRVDTAGSGDPATGISSAETHQIEGAFVVVVDDDQDNRDATAQVLLACGCHVLARASAQEALDALTDHLRVPDLIVSDCRLGAGADGFECIGSLRRLCDDETPALIVTADTDSTLTRRAVDSGIVLLHKPVGSTRLLEAASASIRARAALPYLDEPS